MRKALPAVIAVVILLTGCNSPNSVGNGGSSNATPEQEQGRPQIKAAIVTDAGGVNDRSFNASAWAGMQKAGKELGFEPKVVESKSASDYTANLESLANQKYDIVIAVGFMMADSLKQVAPKYPDVKFAIIDGDAPKTPNAVSIKFKEHEGSYLVGYLAGAMTKTGKAGFVGGMPGPLIKRFEAGYIAGVKTANPKAEVLIAYTGNWDDVGKGKNLALTQFGKGADIVYHAAGKAGMGVIQAASEKGEGYYAIGVDMDQDGEAPGRVLTSMVKRVDNAVYTIIQDAVTDKFKGGERILGVAEQGVGISELKHTKDKIPADTLANLDKLTEMIKNKTLTPPDTDEALVQFKAPKL